MPVAKAQTSGGYVAPRPGLHQAVCVDVIDLDLVQTAWGVKHKVKIRWELDEDHPDFDGNICIAKTYTLSLHEKATLSKDLESWFAKSFNAKQREEGFEVESLIGFPCTLNIVEKEIEGKTYSLVSAVLPPDANRAMEPTGFYVREKDREQKTETRNGETTTLQDELAVFPDDDLPF